MDKTISCDFNEKELVLYRDVLLNEIGEREQLRKLSQKYRDKGPIDSEIENRELDYIHDLNELLSKTSDYLKKVRQEY